MYFLAQHTDELHKSVPRDITKAGVLVDSVGKFTENQFRCDCLAGCSGGRLNHRLGEGLVMMLLLFALPKHLLLVPV